MNNKDIDFHELEKTLIKVHGKIETIEELEKHKGDKFNIFSILKMERLEVSTHSAFLYEFINPNGTHYQGDKYLRIFIDEVLEIKNFDFKNVKKVDRETLIDGNRRIDFTIENNDYYIAIEMKIDATDQNNQLSDYLKYAKKQNKEFTKVYYLTLNGKDATLKSFENKEEIKYEKISFQLNILEFIKKSIEKSANLPIIRESLIQYKYLILKITNQTTPGLQMKSVEFINNPEMAKAATIMSKNLDYAWAKREFLFWEKLEDKLHSYIKDKDNWKFLISNVFFNDNDDDRDDSNQDIINKIINIRNTKSEYLYIDFIKDDFCFKIYSLSSCNFRYQIEFENMNNIEMLAKEINFQSKFNNARYKESKFNLNFCKDYDEPTYDIFNDKKLDEIVKNIYYEIKSYMDIIIKKLS